MVDSCLLMMMIFVISDTQENFRRARDPNKIIVALFLLDFQRCQKYNYNGRQQRKYSHTIREDEKIVMLIEYHDV
jgi:hypothetical protein